MFDYISTPSDITLRLLQRLSKCDSGHYLDPDLKNGKKQKCILNLRISTTQIKPHSPIYKVTGGLQCRKSLATEFGHKQA